MSSDSLDFVRAHHFRYQCRLPPNCWHGYLNARTVAVMSPSNGVTTDAIARLIDEKIAALGDWRGKTLARMRALIRAADPHGVEELKWRGVPVWSHAGGVCTGETYKTVVKLTFHRGASLPDPAGLFNASLDGNVRRAIDIRAGESIDARAFKALIRAAVAFNIAAKTKSAKSRGLAAPHPGNLAVARACGP